MGLWQEIKATLKGTSTNTSLEEAMKNAPQQIAVYKIFVKGKLKYVGLSKKGLNRDLKNYNSGANLNNQVNKNIYEHKDTITVSWRVFKNINEAEVAYEKDVKHYKPTWNIEFCKDS